jgi:hypothetical protein
MTAAAAAILAIWVGGTGGSVTAIAPIADPTAQTPPITAPPSSPPSPPPAALPAATAPSDAPPPLDRAAAIALLERWRTRLGWDPAPPIVAGPASGANSAAILVLDQAPPEAVRRLQQRLDGWREAMRAHLEIPAEDLRPLAILLHQTPDAFAAAEETLFDASPPRRATSRLHPAPPIAAINAFRDPDESMLQPTLARLVGRSLLDRPQDPAPLPAWVREGLASQLSTLALPRHPLERAQRRAGLALLRGGGDPRRVIALEADDPAWEALDGGASGTAFLLVQWIAEHRPRGVAPFIERLRHGATLDEALRAGTGLSTDAFIAAVQRWHRYND